MPTTHVPPDVLAMIVCDTVIADRLTGKQSLIGMFSSVQAFKFPAAHPQLAVYVALTDGRGKTPLELRIVDSEEARPPIVKGGGTVDFKDPRAVANLSLQFHGLVFPEPGEYRVQLWCWGELLREARLRLNKVRPPQRGGPPPTSPPPPETPAF